MVTHVVVGLSCAGDRVRALLLGLDLQNEPLRLGSGHITKGLMAALGAQCLGSAVDAPGAGCAAGGMLGPWLVIQFPHL